tara:strand:- start:1085 stop:1696 length:612 start_codon:yes stop_codon:yes gene_type:complete
MKLNELSPNPGSTKARRRIGRGIGSGKGKTAGSGHNGQKSRSGAAIKGFEGGQMPFYRRLPKRGFTNIFRKEYDIINTGRLQKAVDDGRLDAKHPVDETALKLAGLVRGRGDGVRVLAKGALNTPLTINVTGASKAAVAAVESAGGTITMRRIKEASVEPKKTKNNVAKRKSRSGEKKAKPAAVEENPNSDSGGKSDLGPVDG